MRGRAGLFAGVTVLAAACRAGTDSSVAEAGKSRPAARADARRLVLRLRLCVIAGPAFFDEQIIDRREPRGQRRS